MGVRNWGVWEGVGSVGSLRSVGSVGGWGRLNYFLIFNSYSYCALTRPAYANITCYSLLILITYYSLLLTHYRKIWV